MSPGTDMGGERFRGLWFVGRGRGAGTLTLRYAVPKQAEEQ